MDLKGMCPDKNLKPLQNKTGNILDSNYIDIL